MSASIDNDVLKQYLGFVQSDLSPAEECIALPEYDVELRDVSKRYGLARAVEQINLRVGHGEFYSLLGPSGCGKTTTLRLIAGFERPDSGREDGRAHGFALGDGRTS